MVGSACDHWPTVLAVFASQQQAKGGISGQNGNSGRCTHIVPSFSAVLRCDGIPDREGSHHLHRPPWSRKLQLTTHKKAHPLQLRLALECMVYQPHCCPPCVCSWYLQVQWRSPNHLLRSALTLWHTFTGSSAGNIRTYITWLHITKCIGHWCLFVCLFVIVLLFYMLLRSNWNYCSCCCLLLWCSTCCLKMMGIIFVVVVVVVMLFYLLMYVGALLKTSSQPRTSCRLWRAPTSGGSRH